MSRTAVSINGDDIGAILKVQVYLDKETYAGLFASIYGELTHYHRDDTYTYVTMTFPDKYTDYDKEFIINNHAPIEIIPKSLYKTMTKKPEAPKPERKRNPTRTGTTKVNGAKAFHDFFANAESQSHSFYSGENGFDMGWEGLT